MAARGEGGDLEEGVYREFSAASKTVDAFPSAERCLLGIATWKVLLQQTAPQNTPPYRRQRTLDILLLVSVLFRSEFKGIGF